MEYTEDQLSEWFDFEKVKPTNRGVYQVLYEYDDNTPTYSLFENGFFNFLAHEAKYAELYAEGEPTRHIIYFWRGLKSNPQSPQKPAKKKGNKRKTMYFVIDTGWGYPHAGFENLNNAQDYAENAKRPVRIIKKRFRTPEA